jgi:hypothetical protein
VWHNIGADADHGLWAIAGARQGTYQTMLTDWDHQLVQSFDALADIWQQVQHQDSGILADSLASELRSQLDLPTSIFSVEASAFFKYHYRGNWCNRGVMIREFDSLKEENKT